MGGLRAQAAANQINLFLAGHGKPKKRIDFALRGSIPLIFLFNYGLEASPLAL